MYYYKVIDKIKHLPTDYHSYGYETEHLFSDAVHRLHRSWHGKTGECVQDRHGFRKLRFRNAYGAYDDVWFPTFMLQLTPPTREKPDVPSKVEELLDSIFGFD